MGVFKNNSEKENDLVATSRAERGIACNVLVGCPAQNAGLSVPFNRTGWKPVLPGLRAGSLSQHSASSSDPC
jgi:hypothetical protein